MEDKKEDWMKYSIEELLDERIKLIRKREALVLKEDDIEIPVKPISFNSIGEAEVFKLQYENKHKEKELFKTGIAKINEILDRLEKEIIYKLPFRNTWFKVKDKAVGVKTDAWGGYHDVLVICDWHDDLSKLEDSIYYD